VLAHCRTECPAGDPVALGGSHGSGRGDLDLPAGVGGRSEPDGHRKVRARAHPADEPGVRPGTDPFKGTSTDGKQVRASSSVSELARSRPPVEQCRGRERTVAGHRAPVGPLREARAGRAVDDDSAHPRCERILHHREGCRGHDSLARSKTFVPVGYTANLAPIPAATASSARDRYDALCPGVD